MYWLENASLFLWHLWFMGMKVLLVCKVNEFLRLICKENSVKVPKIGAKHMTQEDKIIYNYDKSLERPCRKVLVRVCTILLEGTPLIEKYDNLSNTKKSKFNPGQKKEISDGLTLNQMDISLLDVIIAVFGANGNIGWKHCNKKDCFKVQPFCFFHFCEELKNRRNTLSHEKHRLSMDKKTLLAELNILKGICKQIFEELKKHCDSSLIPTIEQEMIDTDYELKSLEDTEWKDSEILDSALEEMKKYLAKKCLIDTAEGYDGSHQVSPDDILTDFLMVKVKEESLHKKKINEPDTSKKIEYLQLFKEKTKNNKSVDVIVLTGDGGIGKTTSSKYTANEFCKATTNIQELKDHTLLLYFECRDSAINSLDSLLKKLFPITLEEKCSEDINMLKSIISKNKIITIIDGYDEVNNDTKKVVQEILQLQNLRTIITTRQGHVNRLKCLVTNEGKQYIIFQLLGILPEHHEKFIKKLLSHLMKDKTEKERDKTCEELLCTLKQMQAKLGKVLNTPMVLSNLTHIKVEKPEDLKDFGNNTQVYESLRRLLTRKIHKRMESKVVNAKIDLETYVIPMLMKIHDQLAVKTFMNKQYEFHEDEVSELKRKCKEFDLDSVSDQILSTFFATNVYYDGSLAVKIYKYFHTTDQEFAVAKHLGTLIKKKIMNDSSQDDDQILEITGMIEENIVWQYLNDSKDENDLIQNKPQISRFKYVILFLIGEMSRIEEMAKLSNSETNLINIFEKFSDKLINIGWHLSDSFELSNINYGEDNSSDSIEDHDNENKKTDAQQSKDDEQDKLKYEESVKSEEMEENIEPSTDSNTDVKKQEDDDKEENEESYIFGREDMALKYLTESNNNVYMTLSVISKFETKKTWNIVNGESFSALNRVLLITKPQKIVVSIDTDPTIFPDFRQTISLLTKKEIETELYLHGHYHKEISGFSNDWVKRELNLKEFIGCLNEEGINNLPETLKTLHLAVDHTVLVALNNRLKELKELSLLGLRINLKRDVKNVPCLSSYTGDEMCLTLASDDEFDDDDEFAFWVADITKQIICPVADIKQNVKLKGLWLQETHLTAEGIRKVLTEIHSHELTIIGQLKIWTKEEINPEEKEELNHQAIDMGLGGVIVYDILANTKEGSRPKTMEKGKSDINSINPDKITNSQNMATIPVRTTVPQATFDPREQNVLKLSLCLLKGGPVPRALALIFKHLSQLGTRSFREYCTDVLGYNNKQLKSTFNKDDWAILDGNWDPEKQDCNLLDKLLKHCCGLAKPIDAKWTTQDDTLEYHINYLKNCRTLLAHGKTKLESQELENTMQGLQTHIERAFKKVSELTGNATDRDKDRIIYEILGILEKR